MNTGLATGFTAGNADSSATGNPANPVSVLRLISLYQLRLGGFLVLLSYLLVAFLIYAGWQQRMEWPLSAESGLGYTL
ncbi:MAG: hypothetical protein JSU62_03230, partial [Gammaproteobacteria bacterium]